MPQISVIVPVYGVEQYIEACLRSISAQTFHDFELILVDDGSKDRSMERAEAYLRTTGMDWKCIRQENAGQGPARDRGIRAAGGDYVVCIDADDTVAPCFLQALAQEAARTQEDVVFSRFRRSVIGRKQEVLLQYAPFQTITRQQMLHGFLCRTLIPILPAMLIRKSLLLENDIQSRYGCRFTEDLHIMWRIFAAADKISYTKTPLYDYLIRPGSTMEASSCERIMTGYTAFQEMTNDSAFLPDFLERNYILPRWVLGALNSTARISDYSDFMAVAEQMDYRRCMKALEHFPEWKARLLSRLLLISPKLYHQLLHRRR